jgi:hypothetical protein
MPQQEDRPASTLLGFGSRSRAFPDSFWPVQIGPVSLLGGCNVAGWLVSRSWP